MASYPTRVTPCLGASQCTRIQRQHGESWRRTFDAHLCRSLFQLRSASSGNPGIKTIVQQFADRVAPEIEWRYGRNSKLHATSFDIADAYVIALHSYVESVISGIVDNASLREKCLCALPDEKDSHAEALYERSVREWVKQNFERMHKVRR